MNRLFDEYGLYLAWLVALVATVGSLYFSEVRHFVPCALCWFQRIFMYPLAILLGIASFKQDKGIVVYALPFTVLGGATAVYHLLEQNVPGFAAPAMCQVGVACSGKYINWLGFISIPVLALTAFVLITAVLVGVALTDRQAADESGMEMQGQTQTGF